MTAPPTLVHSARTRLGATRRALAWAWALRALPPRVAWFQLRARWLAARTDESFSLVSATRPHDLATVLELAEGCIRVVELGTGTGWTAVSLALADDRRHVLTFDHVDRGSQRYLDLVARDVRGRIRREIAPGASGPAGEESVDFLYIDSSHEREQTIAEWRAWAPHLRQGAPVVFDDYAHLEFPGVREAVASLGLEGEQRGSLFVHRHAGATGATGQITEPSGPIRDRKASS